MNKVTVYYCKKCGWQRQWNDIITCVNECPNCLDKNLYFIKGPEDEVNNFLIEQEEKQNKHKKYVVDKIIRLWPKNNKL
jgi:DNA-directed RNA polymerase subunit RPC12/RpoP